MPTKHAAVAVADRQRDADAPPNARTEEPKRQPPYHVILWNDDDHSYEYVIPC